MILQNILFPEVGKCTIQEMYFRLEDKQSYINGHKQISFNKKESAKFNTYFNGLSIDKWKKYTKIKDISLCLKLKGKFIVTLVSEEKIRSDLTRNVIAEEIVEASEISDHLFHFRGDEKGIISFQIQALEDGSRFEGGYYFSDVKKKDIRDVKIGVCICTFKREEYIENNVRLLNEAIFNNKESELRDKIEVFISDNGKTLDIDALSSDRIHIFPNRNLGGAGGFTRGLIEILTNNAENKITHALLMDDDIIIETESLVRTFNLLSVLKDEFVDAFIGGAMLRKDHQNIQVEAGAVWHGGELESLKKGIDVKEVEACLYNEIEEYREYNAWWYCCFPIKVVRRDNLPLPIFIRGDDVEYSLRNMKQLILMNGICVWHEPFENKYSSYLNYYIFRNELIDNAFHCKWFRYPHLVMQIARTCIRETLLYRYKNVDLILRGVEDFLKGPKFLMETDGEKLHQEIMAAGYRTEELEKLDAVFNYPVYDGVMNFTENKSRVLKRILMMNGLFVPAKGNQRLGCGRGYTIIPVETASTKDLYRMKKVLHYDVTTNKGFVTKRSYVKTVACMLSLAETLVHAARTYSKVKRQWRKEGLKLRTLEFWRKYLDL